MMNEELWKLDCLVHKVGIVWIWVLMIAIGKKNDCGDLFGGELINLLQIFSR